MPFMKLNQIFDSVSTRLLHVRAWRVVLTGGVLLSTFLYLRSSSSTPPRKWREREKEYHNAEEVEDGVPTGENKSISSEPGGISIYRKTAIMTEEYLLEAHLGLQMLHNCDEPTIE